MALNYATLAAKAKVLVDGAGRPVTLVQFDYDAADLAKPWRGPEDPRATPAQTLALRAAFVSLAGNAQLGLSKQAIDLAKKSTATCLIGSTIDLTPFQELIDSKDGRAYKITHSEVLAPGELTIVTFMVLNQ